ncbi:MAG TPA: NAD-dependent epimerase/dehydratase family protein [Polyangiaceae bacterium]|nr:NAD-dependent epimerase/dehydratase family protein [Polyangiaceae bacterium]
MTADPKKTVLVTGAAGFIGSHLCESLLEEGWTVYGADKLDDYYPAELKIQQIAPSLTKLSFSFEVIDLGDAVATHRYAAKIPRPDVVVHLAAVAGVRLSVTDPARYVRANLVATQNVLDAWSREAKVPLVFASSSSVYGNNSRPPFSEDEPCIEPPSPYAATKRGAELLCHVAHLIHAAPITSLRFFTVYGRRQRPDLAIRKFSTAILRDKEVTVFGDGSMARDFTHVSDIVRGIRSAMNETSGYRTVNLGNSAPCSVNDLVAKLGKALGKAPRVRLVDRPAGEMNATFADVRRAASLWGWKPEVPLDDGLADFARWLEVEERAGRNP